MYLFYTVVWGIIGEEVTEGYLSIMGVGWCGRVFGQGLISDGGSDVAERHAVLKWVQV